MYASKQQIKCRESKKYAIVKEKIENDETSEPKGRNQTLTTRISVIVMTFLLI